MTISTVPVYVTLRWLPGSPHLVHFMKWGRSFVLQLRDVVFTDAQGFAPLYLLGRVQVNVTCLHLSSREQVIYDDLNDTARLSRASAVDNVSRETLRLLPPLSA